MANYWRATVKISNTDWTISLRQDVPIVSSTRSHITSNMGLLVSGGWSLESAFRVALLPLWDTRKCTIQLINSIDSFDSLTVVDVNDGSPETSISNLLTPRNNPEDATTQFNCGGSHEKHCHYPWIYSFFTLEFLLVFSDKQPTDWDESQVSLGVLNAIYTPFTSG